MTASVKIENAATKTGIKNARLQVIFQVVFFNSSELKLHWLIDWLIGKEEDKEAPKPESSSEELDIEIDSDEQVLYVQDVCMSIISTDFIRIDGND